MTTVAYRDGVLAADALVTCGRGRSGTATKAWKTPDGALWAVTGKMAHLEACLEWSNGDRIGPGPTMTDATFIHITRDGRVREWWGDGWCETKAPFFSWGSGDDYAMGAMGAGASADEAVHIAIRFDTASGGDVTVLKLGA